MSKSSQPSNSPPPPPAAAADTSPLSSTIPMKKRKLRPLGRKPSPPPTDPVPSAPSLSSSVHPTAPQPSSPPAEPRPEIPTSFDGIIEYIQGRRLGLIKALTTDLEDLFKKCHPDDKHNMCLYGLPSGKWKVSSASVSVPLDFSESMVGIHCGRDEMNKKKWAADVALRCDMWLVALAVYFGSKIGLDNDGRGKLFEKINEKRTLLEVVEKVMKTGANTTKDVTRNGANNITDISATNSREVQSEGNGKNKEGIEQSDNNICGACTKAESPINWVRCDGCDEWFHCECVGITGAQAESMKLFLCPTCSKPVKVQESAHHL